jgi:SAM-dependent methyltransferase
MKYDNELVTQASRIVLEQGIRVLQGNRLADTETRHLDALAAHMGLDSEQAIADMGCGFGEVSRFLSLRMPDTHFWLININPFQLDECPSGDNFTVRFEDMCSTSIPDGVIDFVMFNYSLCHVDPEEALLEAARIGAKKARLFVYDYVRRRGDDNLTEQHLTAKFMRDWEFRGHALNNGWKDIETIPAPGDDSLFRDAVDNPELYHAMFDEIEPVIWKAHK